MNTPLESGRRAPQRPLRVDDVRHEPRELALMRCGVGCGAPLRLHFESGVVGRGRFIGCARARRREARADQGVAELGHDTGRIAR